MANDFPNTTTLDATTIDDTTKFPCSKAGAKNQITRAELAKAVLPSTSGVDTGSLLGYNGADPAWYAPSAAGESLAAAAAVAVSRHAVLKPETWVDNLDGTYTTGDPCGYSLCLSSQVIGDGGDIVQDASTTSLKFDISATNPGYRFAPGDSLKSRLFAGNEWEMWVLLWVDTYGAVTATVYEHQLGDCFVTLKVAGSLMYMSVRRAGFDLDSTPINIESMLTPGAWNLLGFGLSTESHTRFSSYQDMSGTDPATISVLRAIYNTSPEPIYAVVKNVNDGSTATALSFQLPTRQDGANGFAAVGSGTDNKPSWASVSSSGVVTGNVPFLADTTALYDIYHLNWKQTIASHVTVSKIVFVACPAGTKYAQPLGGAASLELMPTESLCVVGSVTDPLTFAIGEIWLYPRRTDTLERLYMASVGRSLAAPTF